MPPTGKRPKKTPIMSVGLPPIGKKDKGKGKVVCSPSVVNSSGDEALDWGSDDGRLYDALDEDIAESAGLERRALSPHAFLDTDYGMDIGGGTAYDHISPQVPSLSFGILGSLIVEQQGQLHNGLVDSSFNCICNLEATISLSANCTNCKKCKSNDPMGAVKDLVKRLLLKKKRNRIHRRFGCFSHLY